MSIEYYVKPMYDVQVGADGEIEIMTTGGYHGEDVERMFTIGEMEHIVKIANAHYAAYTAYENRGYEDEDKYHADYLELTA